MRSGEREGRVEHDGAPMAGRKLDRLRLGCRRSITLLSRGTLTSGPMSLGAMLKLGAALMVTGPADPGRPAVAKIIGVIAGAGGGDKISAELKPRDADE